MKSFNPVQLAAAYGMDLALGDPPWAPHPVRLMGSLISTGERLLKPGSRPRIDLLSGTALSIITITASWSLGAILIRLCNRTSPAVSRLAEVALASTTLATTSLVDESGAVARALESGDLNRTRLLLSRIVGRDTATFDEHEIARAIIETVAEGLCDGVVAPLFYLALGGVPLALAYKAVNTLDSMIGHPEHPYTHFGRFAARLDDGANFLPARITALFIIIAAGLRQFSHGDAYRTWRRDGDKHPSPNAGQSEAAMAGALGVQLGGTNVYQGTPSIKPLLGQRFRRPSIADARKSIALARMASLLAFTAAFAWCSWKSRQ